MDVYAFALPGGTPQTPEAISKAIEEMMKHPENVGRANVSAGNTTMDDFRKTLEMSMGRPVIDETGLDGVYDIAVQGEAKNTGEFIRMLREQTRLVLTPATRSVRHTGAEVSQLIPLRISGFPHRTRRILRAAETPPHCSYSGTRSSSGHSLKTRSAR